MKIVIADDSSFVRTIINKIVSTEFPDAQIRLCTNGKEAFDAYMDMNPDWLITDLLMPEMSGQQLLSALNIEGKKGKYIVVSADVQKVLKKKSKDTELLHLLINRLLPISFNSLLI